MSQVDQEFRDADVSHIKDASGPNADLLRATLGRDHHQVLAVVLVCQRVTCSTPDFAPMWCSGTIGAPVYGLSVAEALLAQKSSINLTLNAFISRCDRVGDR